MIDLASIQSAISGLKAANDIAKAMVTLRDATIVQTKTIELQSAILAAQASAVDAQSQQMSMIERIRDLEKELAEVKAWETEKQRYELHDLGEGRFTYLVKQSMRGTEPEHQLCANCYNARSQKSILQEEVRYPGMSHVLVCHSCGAEIYKFGQRHPQHSTPPPRRPRGR